MNHSIYHRQGLREASQQFWCFIIPAWVSYDCGALRMQILFNDLDVDAYIFKNDVSIETLDIPFESTKNRQQYKNKQQYSIHA